MPEPTTVFLFGTLRDPALARIVFGADEATVRARLTAYSVRRSASGDWPTLVKNDSDAVEGLCVTLSGAALARADFYEALFGYMRAPVTVELGGRTAPAEVWFPPKADAEAGSVEPWALGNWQDRHAPLARVAAQDVMAHFGTFDVKSTAARLPMIRARAQARLNAREAGPTALRRRTAPGDLDLRAQRIPYAQFFSVEEYDLSHARFAGGLSEQITRAVFIGSDAVTILPYDPARDRVLLIEQFRPGPLARGEDQLWSLEAIAGRIDGGETPQEAAHREAQEEAGLGLSDLLPLAQYYPTPGAMSEFLYSFIGLADLPDGVAGFGGLDAEHEDIRAHLVSFNRLMALVETGEITNGPLILSALFLAARRPMLRDDADVRDTGAR